MNKDSDEDSGSGSQRKDDENSTKPEEGKESTVKDNNGESESAGTKSTIHEDKKNSPKDGSLPQGMNVILNSPYSLLRSIYYKHFLIYFVNHCTCI